MVKVQKPQPKSLNKSASIEGVVKKKGKPEKTKKLATDATLELASNKKAKNAAPVKKDAIKKEPEVSKKGAEKKQSKAAKRPLILAPPESPAAPHQRRRSLRQSRPLLGLRSAKRSKPKNL